MPKSSQLVIETAPMREKSRLQHRDNSITAESEPSEFRKYDFSVWHYLDVRDGAPPLDAKPCGSTGMRQSPRGRYRGVNPRAARPARTTQGESIGVDRTVIERALQLLLHARNSHGPLRAQIRSLIRANIKLLKGAA
jgi:hypothetical protein